MLYYSFIALTSVFALVAIVFPFFGLTSSIVLNPVVYDLSFSEGIRINPAVIILFFGFLGFILKGLKAGDIHLKTFIFFKKNSVAKLYLLLIIFLFMSWLYAFLLTGILDRKTGLEIGQIALSFLVYPLAFFCGRGLVEKRLRKIIFFLILGAVFSAIIGLWPVIENIIEEGIEVITNYYKYGPELRVIGAFGQYIDSSGIQLSPGGASIHAGMYFALIFGLLFSFWASKEFIFNKKWFFLFSCFLITANLLALSRVALITLLIISFVIIMKKFKTHQKVIIFSSLILLIILIFIFFPEMPFIKKVIETIQIQDGKIILESSAAQRPGFWAKALEAQLSNPLFALFGYGYSEANNKYFADVGCTHSLFIDIFVKTGIIGLSILILLWISIFLKLSFLYKITKKNFLKSIFLVLSSFYFGWLFSNLFSGGDFFSDRLTILFWGLLGITEGFVRANKQINFNEKENKE